MDEHVSQDAGIVALLANFADIVIANFLWIITAIPIFTLGASTAALYSVLRAPRENQYASSIFVKYFTAFAKNFKKTALIFLLLLLPAAFVAYNIYLLVFGLLADNILGYILCCFSIVLFFFLWVYVFPLAATFENRIFKTIANGLMLSVAHFPTTLAILILWSIPVLVLVFFTNFFFRTIIIWLFVVFALIAKANAFLLERVFRRYIP